MRCTDIPNSRQRGSSLLEVLVAILVMSVGMLGMAGLTAASSTYNKLSQIRSTALLLVSDYADRARANVPGFDSANYAKTTTYQYSKTPVTATGCTDATVPCDAATMAALDQAQWINLLRLNLPGGDAYVQTTADLFNNQRTMDIWVMWSEVEQASGFAMLGNTSCPAAATTSAAVKCMYFRIAL
ncbi:MAG: type IV pilus modification protein PilV [Burkholderiaceae bacterium]